MTDPYIVRAALSYLGRLEGRGLTSGRPIRIDGFTRSEVAELQAAIGAARPTWRLHVLSPENDEASGRINAERATRFRNEAAAGDSQPFLLLVPLGVVVESSLNEPAFYVVSRATIFSQALAETRKRLAISVTDVQGIRETSVNSQPESVYAFLETWHPVDASIDAESSQRYLGLLADSALGTDSIAELRARLRRNAEAVEILTVSGVAPGRMVGELVSRFRVAGDQRDEFLELRAWLLGGRVGQRPRLGDFAEWTPVTDPPILRLEPNLTKPPHVGWVPGDPVPKVEDPHAPSKVAWTIDNRTPGLRVEIDVIEETSQTVVKSLGRTQSLSKAIKWQSALGNPDTLEAIREANPAGDATGYFFRLRLRLIDGKSTLQDPETEPFQVELDEQTDGLASARLAPTAWHALYKVHTERGASPSLVTSELDDPLVVDVEVSNGRNRRARVSVSPVLAAIEQALLAQPSFAGTWQAHVSPATAAAPSTLDVLKLRDGIKDDAFLRARTRFFEVVRHTGRIIETLDTRDPDVRGRAEDYVRSWVEFAGRHAEQVASAPGGLSNQARLDAARIGSIDTIRLVFPGEHDGEVHETLLMSPLHPAVVAWALDFHDLVHAWTRGVYDHTVKPPYRATTNSPAALGGIEGYSAGPRSMVAFTAFEDELVPTGWGYSGSAHPLWQCYVRVNADVGARSREWPEHLAKLLSLTDVPAGGNRIDASRVGSRLKKYAIFHPWVRQMKIAALLAGDGHPMLDALKAIDERTGTPAGAESIRDLRYELQLIGPRSDRLGFAIEDLTSNPGDSRWRGYAATVLDNPETVLSPGFSFGVTSIEGGGDEDKSFWASARDVVLGLDGGVNVTVVGALLATQIRAVPALDAVSSLGKRGLISRPSTVVAPEGDRGAFAGNWTLVLPRPMPDTPAASGQRALLRSFDVAGGASQTEMQIGLDAGLAGPSSEALAAAHEKSDWVVIADPLFSIELMDRSDAKGGTLLDYSPEFDSYPSGRVVVSTNSLSRFADGDGHGPAKGVVSPALTRVLGSISARLLLTLANPTKQVVRGLHGLALTRVYLRSRFPDAVVIPMDGHADMFAVPRVSGTARLADLLAVALRDGRLHLSIVESKWVGKANLQAKSDDAVTQVQTSVEVLRAEFIEYQGVDRDLRIDALREIILFHYERAIRHGLGAPFERDELLRAMQTTEEVGAAAVDGQVVVWCPDLDGDARDEQGGISIQHFGETGLRWYFEALDAWPDAPGRNPGAASPTTETIVEELIDSTLEDELAEREEAETAPVAGDEPAVELHSFASDGPVEHEPSSPPRQPPSQGGPPAAVDSRSRAQPNDQPTPAEPEGPNPIHLGKRAKTGEDVTWSPYSLANGHMAVLGGSGSGKTTLLRKLARCLGARDVPVLVLDFHGDLTLPPGQRSFDFTYDANANFINPFHLDSAFAREISPSRLKWEFIEAWRSQYPTLGIQQRNYLTTLIEDAFVRAGITSDAASWGKQVDFGDVLEAFERSDASDAQKQRIDAYMKQYREWCVFHGNSGISVESMLQQSTRLNLVGLDEGARNIVADVVLRRLFLLATALGPLPPGTNGWDKFRAFVVIDEAQKLLGSNGDARASLAKYAAEARKFGIGLILATQLRDNIPGDVWGNIDTRIWMLALDQVERQKNARAADLSEQAIASLKVGEAFLVASSQPGVRPVQLKIDPETC